MAGCGGPRQQSLPETAALEEPAALCERIDAVLAAARDTRRLDASVHGAWQAVLGILAFGAGLMAGPQVGGLIGDVTGSFRPETPLAAAKATWIAGSVRSAYSTSASARAVCAPVLQRTGFFLR